jgi:Tol biopolymer transport system component
MPTRILERLRWSALVLLGAQVFSAPLLHAQYFGRTKVQYENFKFHVMRSPHFDIHFYPEEAQVTADAARMAERWYTRHSSTLGHRFTKKPLIFYANQPDFQQTNVIQDQLTEETGGVTEGLRNRVIMPFTGIYADNDHVLGHELVHVFQYDIAESGEGGIQRMGQLPLWLVEGMAEYLSLGRNDTHTAMWLRDAALRGKLPTIKQLTTDPRFFPYRYGEALWAYIGGRWGDRAVAEVYRAALSSGWNAALRRVLRVNSDTLSKQWIAQIRADYLPQAEGRTPPDQVGERVIMQGKRGGEPNLSPVVSPDGQHVAFFSMRGLFGDVALYIADAQTGRIIRELSAPQRDAHLDALSFIYTAGTWSPDGRQLAAIAYERGDHSVIVIDVNSGDITRRIRAPQLSAIHTIAWSPDGQRLAISGGSGGLTDLYIYNLESGTVDQLTNDRYADIQPAWSPDGKTIAFSTDRGEGTDFTMLTYARQRLALIDVSSREVRVLPVFDRAKHINPQFSPDGADLYFVSDQDGFSDIYRYTIAGGSVSRVTRVTTGVTGITTLSPAMSVSAKTGRLLFSVFQNQGYSIFGLSGDRTRGTPVERTTPTTALGALPPVQPTGQLIVQNYLAQPQEGLPGTEEYPVTPYRARLGLSYLGNPSIGVASGPFGTGIAGGISAYFSDMLENHVLGAAIDAQGSLQDIGGQVLYINQQRRWNWFVAADHIPYLTGYSYIEPESSTQTWLVSQVLQRIFIDQVAFGTQYPFTQTRRFEMNVGYTRYGFSTEIQRVRIFQDQVVEEFTEDTASPPGLGFGQASAALVGDNSRFAFTSPIVGHRYRFEATQNFGQLNFTTLLGDARRYFFLQPVTFAFRGMHYGRYGSGSETDRISPLFVGDPTLVRGYAAESFDPSECSTTAPTDNGCPEFERMLGSRVAVANFEMRIPLFGTERFGLINFPFLPTELAPFVDAGVAWTGTESARFAFERNTTDRVPIVSAGVAARINILGYAVGEVYWAKPFQRPGVGWQFGFQLIPGW